MTHWVYGPEQNVKCPTCGKTTTGLDWETQDNGDEGTTVTGMVLQPCGDTISAREWEIKPAGVDGRLTLTKITS